MMKKFLKRWNGNKRWWELFYEGYKLFLLSDMPGAIRCFDEAIRLQIELGDTSASKAYFFRGRAKNNLSRYLEAIEDFDEAIRINPNVAKYYLWRGIAKKALGDCEKDHGYYEAAIMNFDATIRLKPNKYPKAYIDRAKAKYDLGRHEAVIQDLDEAIRILLDEAFIMDLYEKKKSLTIACQFRGAINNLMGRYEEAWRDSDQAITNDPQCDQAWNVRAVAKINLGHFGEGARDFDEAIRLNPKNARYYNNLALSKAKQNSYEEAIVDYDQAIRLDPNEATYYHHRGISKANLGRYEAALLDIDKAVDLDSQCALFYTSRGRIKNLMGHYADAQENCNKAIEVDPQNWSARVEKCYTYLLLKNLKLAMESLTELSHLAAKDNEILTWIAELRALMPFIEGPETSQWNPAHLGDSLEKLPPYRQAGLLIYRGLVFGVWRYFQQGIESYQWAKKITPWHEGLQEKTDGLREKIQLSQPLSIASQAKTTVAPRASSGMSAASAGKQPKLDAAAVARTEICIPGEDVHFNPADKLGEGAFGIVYQGNYSGRKVALKALVCELVAKTQEVFLKELELMICLRSPQIVEVYGAVMEAGFKQMIVMELMPNGSLYALLRNNAELPMDVKESIALDIAYGVRYLHGQKILHRDLKSLNVLLDDRLRAKISDFGLADVKTQSQSMKTQKEAVGSTLWMAPELFDRKARFSEKSDIYALAMVLYEMLTHKVPFEDDLDGRLSLVGTWVCKGDRPDLPESAPLHWLTLIAQCWAGDGASRPDARSVAKTIEGWSQLMPAPVKPQPSPDLLTSGPQYFAASGVQLFSISGPEHAAATQRLPTVDQATASSTVRPANP